MKLFRRRHRRMSAGSIYAPARHRVVDTRYAAALVEVGYSCKKDDAAGPDVAPASASVRAADSAGPNVRVLAFHGELDLSRRESIEAALAQIERFVPTTVAILDLSDVQYLDTTFLNALLHVGRLFGNDGGNRLRIVAPHESMPERILAITKLDARFDVFEDLASAQR